jgi:NADH-quinone oxidoreductase subunit J
MTGFEQFFFYLFGLVALASALLFVTRKSPVAAALWLVSVMFSLAALYILMDAQFVGAVQVLVYAGAIMVVFLFVVMLLNLGESSAAIEFRANGTRIAAGLVGLAILAGVLAAARGPSSAGLVPATTFTVDANGPADVNVIAPVASVLFTRHLLAFEVTSLLLLAAVVGAVVLAKPRRDA